MKLPTAQCVRGASVRVCIALIFGLLVVSGYVVAPILFAKAATPTEAGILAGEIFHLVNKSTLLLVAVVGSFWFRMKDSENGVSRLSWILLCSLLVLIFSNEFLISPILTEIKETAGPIHELAVDDARRTEFGMWHGLSAILHLLASFAAVFLVMFGDQKRDMCKRL